MTTLKNYALLFFLFFNFYLFAQNPEQLKILTKLTDYFKLDRENIHAHLNKSTYLTNETIWFKGYVIEKKDKMPFAGTSNVVVNLLDQSGNKLSSRLLYCDNSIFQGGVKLDKTIATGKYYLRFFTNYMNNFEEDESSVYEINVVNIADDSYADSSQINYNEIETTFFPESGIILEGTSNTIAIKINDCNGNGIAVTDGNIIDSKGVVATNFSTNSFGYGKFDIVSTTSNSYKAVYTANNKKIEKILPDATLLGMSLSANNFTFADKTIVKVKTNQRSLKDKNNEPFTLVIQQADKASFVDFSFGDKTEQTIPIPNLKLSEGINTIYLIDKSSRELAQRIIFVPMPMLKVSDLKIAQKRTDSLVVAGSSQLPLASLSISVLPVTERYQGKSIVSEMIFDNYLAMPTNNADYLLGDSSRRKQYELDTYLITTHSKYKWENMMNVAPVEKFEFDKGLTIKGSVNNTIADRNNSKLNIISLKRDLNESTTIDEKNEFIYKNVFALDSTVVYYNLINKKDKITDLRLYTQILNGNRQFMKPLNVASKICSIKTNIVTNKNAFPRIEKSVLLDSVTVMGKKSEEKKRIARGYGASFATAVKINPEEAGFRDILDLITEKGYRVNRTGAGVTIANTYSRSITGGAGSPEIFIDNLKVDDLSVLTQYRLKDVDEVYFNKRGAGEGLNGFNGTIRIYMRSDYLSKSAQKKLPQQTFLIKNGFQSYNDFTNPKYESVTDEGFQTYGTVNWLPQVNTDKDGNFKFSIPNLEQKSVTVIIEGIASDGQIISERRTLELQ